MRQCQIEFSYGKPRGITYFPLDQRISIALIHNTGSIKARRNAA